MPRYERQYEAASLDDLPDFRAFVEKTVLSLGASEDEAADLVMAANEAITNIIIHGYGEKAGDISVTIQRSGNQIIVGLFDHATSFDPETVPEPDITIPLDQRKLGGMGVHMMRSFTDSMEYSASSTGGNELLLVKLVSSP